MSIAGVVITVALCSTVRARPTENNPQSEPPKVIRKSESVLQASAIKRVEPVYPPLAKASQIRGAVFVEVTIGEEGNVISARAISGHPLLKDSAVTAAKGWTFTQTKVNGVPVKVIGTLRFNFQSADLDNQEKSEDDEVADARKAVEANPRSAEANYALGQALADDDRSQEGILSFREALRLKRDYKEAYLSLAAALHTLSRHDEETIVYRQALDALPDDLHLLEAIGKQLLAREHKAEALEFLNQLVKFKPQDVELRISIGRAYIDLGRYDEAVQANQDAIHIKHDSAGAYHNLGWAYYKLKRYQEALSAFENVVTLEPGYFDLHRVFSNIGLVYIRLQRYEEAVSACKRAIQIDPSNPYGYTGLADAYYFQERYDQALEMYKRGIEIGGVDDYMVYGNLGSLYLELGNVPEAEKAFRDAIRYKPDFSQGYVELADTLYRQRRIAEAEAALRDAVRIEPGNPDYHLLLGVFLGHTRKTTEAEDEYRLVLGMQPNKPLALNNLGYLILERNGNATEALQMIQRANDAEPGNGYFLDSLGWAYFKLGKLDEAQPYLTEAARLVMSSATIQEHLGDLYQRKNNPKEAHAAWQKALSLSVEPEQQARLKSKLAGTRKK